MSYREVTGSELFALGVVPVLEWNKKPFESVVEKLFRANCLENERFPEPPQNGWLSLSRVFERIRDIVRTTCVVGYADGPRFLSAAIEACAERCGLSATCNEHAKEKGYYAHHVYAQFSVPVPVPGEGTIQDQLVAVEIQIATQLQGALREVTHGLYEKERLQRIDDSTWKHDFGSGRFRAAYMAHSLRFIEAMIVELRSTVTDAKEKK